MKIKITLEFKEDLIEIVNFISKDKPKAAKKFHKELVENIKKYALNPYSFKQSKYFDKENYRDYVFKGYSIILRVEELEKVVFVIGIIKNKNSYY